MTKQLLALLGAVVVAAICTWSYLDTRSGLWFVCMLVSYVAFGGQLGAVLRNRRRGQ